MKTALVKFLEEFAEWWKNQENPNTNDFIRYKIEKNELKEVSDFTQRLSALGKILVYKHGKS